MSTEARWGFIVVCILFVLFLVFGFTVPVKIQSYTEQEAFTDYRTRIEKEPYEVTETYSAPYTATVIKYRQECYTATVQVPCGTYVCGQDCYPQPPQDCRHLICTRYCPEPQISCNSVPYPEEITKYREAQRTVTKWRDKEVTEPFTNYRTTIKYRSVPLFSP